MKKVKYTYTSSIDYINNLDFDYLETYSLLRGKEFEENKKRIISEYEILKEKKINKELSPSKEARFSELDGLLGYTQYLINEEGQFHPSSKKTNTFKKNAPIVERLKNILRTQIKQKPKMLCAPEYRDAIVFFNSDSQIVSCLNVCLSCNYMETKRFSHINADYETYDLLKRFFIELGHEVEDPDYFIWEDLQKQLKKIKV